MDDLEFELGVLRSRRVAPLITLANLLSGPDSLDLCTYSRDDFIHIQDILRDKILELDKDLQNLIAQAKNPAKEAEN